ncbi:MAG: hypothetical protein LAO07_20580, partial [Acidobacteriia bacterium]|nr:hypothetical protein [Terriglobia bacterium]
MAQKRFRIVAGIGLAVGIAAGLTLYFIRRPSGGTQAVIAQSYILQPTSMRASPAPEAAPVKDFQGSEIVNITDDAIDMMGNRWFRITSGGKGLKNIDLHVTECCIVMLAVAFVRLQHGIKENLSSVA